MSFLGQMNLTTTQQHSKLSPNEFERLRKYIYNTTGIFFPDNKKYLLESRVGQRLATLNFGSFDSYLDHLRNGQGATEIPALINAITINETFFFRNEPQLEVVEQELLPKLAETRQKQGKSKVRIWSAACSSGEEPYTLAMIIKNKIQPRFPRMQFEILGTDINTHVLQKARTGIYREYAVRKAPKNYFTRYFREDKGRFMLQPSILKMVDFRRLNLFDRRSMQMMRNFDMIFCANVLIYFDADSKKQVVNNLYDALNNDGYLLLGYSESLYGVSQAFKPIHFTKTIAYHKE